MRARLFRDPPETRAIEFHGKHLFLPGIALVGGEIDEPGILVDSFHSHHFKLALCELSFELRLGGQRVLLVEAVQIKMGVAIAPARPQKPVT